MRILPISDILTQLDHDDTVDSVVAQVIDIHKRHSGTNANGEWSLQNLLIRDATGEIKVQLKDREDFPTAFKNRVVCFECNQGPKGKTGLKAKDDEYKGKKSRILSVTPTAQIDLHEQATPATPPPQQTQRPPAAPPTQTAPQHQSPPQQTNGNGNGHTGRDVRKVLNKLANLYLHCYEAGDYVYRTVNEMHGPDSMNADQFQACVSSLFIAAQREGLELDVQGGKFQK